MNTDTESESTLPREQKIFESYSVPKAVASMAIPTVISQIITVIYNLADTWYIGLTKNAAAVAAVSLCLPVYNIMTALANLFGIGGSSVIARAMGKNDERRAQAAYALSVRGAIITAIVYSLLLLLSARPFLMLIGGDESSIDYAVQYALVTMTAGGVPTILSAVFAHLVRNTGKAKAASFGITLGAILNMALDPLFMFVFLPKGNEVLGAALATAISNLAAMSFFIIYIRKQKHSIFRLSVQEKTLSKNVLFEIIKCGLPSFALLGAAQISNFVLNGLIGQMQESTEAIAGIGVVRKIDSLAYSVNQGITQGMLPIVAYCFSSRKYKRMNAVIAFSTVCAVSFSLVCSLLAYIFAPSLIKFFIDEPLTIRYGSKFLRIMCISVALYPLTFVVVAVFQAAGESLKAFLLSLVHKGSVDIALLFVMKKLFGLDYILWTSPLMEAIALIVAIVLFFKWSKTLKKTRESNIPS